MKSKYKIGLSDLKLVPSGLVVSDHFVSRWNERINCSWERFCWALNSLNIMCTDDGKKKHCLYYDPTHNVWYVFLISKEKMLVTILTEEIYMRQSNAVLLSPNKEIALNNMITNNIITPMGRYLKLVVVYKHSRRMVYNISWKHIFTNKQCLDNYIIQNNFEEFCESIISTQEFINWLTNTVDLSNVRSASLNINDKIQEIDIVLPY